jgi:hypothetical protein
MLMMSICFAGATLAAQTPPAQSPPPQAGSGDPPSVRVGATLFNYYTYTTSPESVAADGNPFRPSQFNVGRSYLNVTGNISRLVAFRVTPDIVRESGAGSTLNGSLTFRLKYAFGQFNLDEWTTTGTWIRFGIQQTPWVDFQEGVYRYRFQGTVFSEREGYLSSSDAGASFHYNLPSNYGDLHVGVYNGESYNRSEVNGQKAFQVRGSVRPFGGRGGVLQGLRVHAFHDADSYVKDGARRRTDVSATFEHPFLNAGIEYLATADQASIVAPRVEGRGYSIWITPLTGTGWEALLRFDHMTPDTSDVASDAASGAGPRSASTRTRTIAGIAYWFPHQGSASTALLVDYDGQRFHRFAAPVPDQKRIAVHALINF